MTAPIDNRTKQQLFRLYKTNPNAVFIAEKSGIGHGSVLNLIKQERFKERYDMIKTAALQIVDTNQAELLATNILELCNIEDLIKESLLSNPEREFSVTDLDKIMRLKYHLLGMPDVNVSVEDATIEVQQVQRTDIIDAEFKSGDDEKTK